MWSLFVFALKTRLPFRRSSNLCNSTKFEGLQSRISWIIEVTFSWSFKSRIKCFETTTPFILGLIVRKWLWQFTQNDFLFSQELSNLTLISYPFCYLPTINPRPTLLVGVSSIPSYHSIGVKVVCDFSYRILHHFYPIIFRFIEFRNN